MSPPAPFTSAIGPVIARYVALKQALGRRFDTPRYLLARVDGFLAARHATDLTAETFSAWGSSITHLMPSGRRMRMQIVRQFCLYRRRSEPVCFVPDPSQFPPPQPRRRPYVFSEDEIARLLRAAGALRHWGVSPLYRQVARLALVRSTCRWRAASARTLSSVTATPSRCCSGSSRHAALGTSSISTSATSIQAA